MEILVIESSKVTRMVIAKFFRQLDWKVTFADDGFDATAKLNDRSEIGLVITGLHTPGLSGLSLISVIRKSRLTTPVWLLTSDDRPEVVEEAMTRGANQCISKNESCHDFRRRVRLFSSSFKSELTLSAG